MREIERHVHQLHALRIGGPVGDIALAIRRGLDNRNAEHLEFALAPFRVQHDLRVDDDVRQRLAAQAHDRRKRLHYRAVERQRQCTCRFDACDQVVDEGSLLGGDVGLMQSDADRRRLALRIDALPAQVLGCVGKHLAGCLRVVQRGFWKHQRRRDACRFPAGQVRSNGFQKTVIVGAATIDIVGVQTARQRIGQAAPFRALLVQPQAGCLQSGQRAHQPCTREIAQVVARRVEEHRIVTGKQRHVLLHRQLLDEAHLHGQAERPGEVLDQLELAGRDRTGGEEQQPAGVRTAGAQQQRASQQASGKESGHG